MTENKNVILSARDIVVEFDVRDRVLTEVDGKDSVNIIDPS